MPIMTWLVWNTFCKYKARCKVVHAELPQSITLSLICIKTRLKQQPPCCQPINICDTMSQRAGENKMSVSQMLLRIVSVQMVQMLSNVVIGAASSAGGKIVSPPSPLCAYLRDPRAHNDPGQFFGSPVTWCFHSSFQVLGASWWWACCPLYTPSLLFIVWL